MHYGALVDDQERGLAVAIGSRVRLRRQARSWTLDQLASASGVSRRALVNVEQGAANPSVGTLLRIGDALGVGLPALVAPARSEAATVTRSGEGAVLWTGGNGGRGVLVAGSSPPDVVELWDWSLAPGDRHESEAHTAGTKELIQVLAGTVTVQVAEEEHVLSPGDAIAFPGDLPHGYANRETLDARFSLAVFEPSEGGKRS